MQVDLHTPSGETNGTVELDDAVFAAPINVPVMHQVVVAQLASARRGTSKVLKRGEVSGGGKKPWRQKGTGRARQGSTRAPHWSGGGVAHGPSGEQNYSKRVNRKMRQVALRSALSDRAASGDLRVVEAFGLDAPRTKDAVALLDAFELGGKRVLLVLADRDEAVWRSFRNLTEVHTLTVDQLNTYDVLVSDVVLIHVDAVGLVGTGKRSGAAAAAPDEDEEAA